MLRGLYIKILVLTVGIVLLSSCAFAGEKTSFAFTGEEKIEATSPDKYEFCSGRNSYSKNGRRWVSKKDLRDITIPANGLIEVDGKQNGGISVRGENRSDVLVRACIRAHGESEADAITALNNTRIETSGVIRATNSDEDAKVYVSYRLLVPLQTDLKLNAHNGGISIKSVEGNLEFETHNGGLSLKDVAGDVRGKTRNGGVSVKLSGTSWRGEGLDVVTTNGGVKLVLPKNYSADVESGTTNGGFRSDFDELKIARDEKRRWHRPKKVRASLNGGGAKVRVITTNGGVKIASAED